MLSYKLNCSLLFPELSVYGQEKLYSWKIFFPAQDSSTKLETAIMQANPGYPGAGCTSSLSGGLLSHGKANSDFNVFAGSLF